MMKFIIGGAIVVAAGIAVVCLSKKSAGKVEFVKILDMSEILAFFKRDDVVKKLQENSNLIAAAIREKKDDGKFRIVAAVFDKEKNQIADMNNAKVWLAEKISDDLTEAFGDKSMIVLK